MIKTMILAFKLGFTEKESKSFQFMRNTTYPAVLAALENLQSLVTMIRDFAYNKCFLSSKNGKKDT